MAARRTPNQRARSHVTADAARRQHAFDQEAIALVSRARFVLDVLFRERGTWRGAVPRHQALHAFAVKVLVDFAEILKRYPGVPGPRWGRRRLASAL